MAVIKYDELFDFPGYEKAIKGAEKANASFGKTIGAILKRLTGQYRELKEELDGFTGVLKGFNVNQKAAGETIIRTGEAAVKAAKKLAEQKRVMEELKAVNDLSTKSINSLKVGYNALLAEYSKLDAIEQKDIARKKQLKIEVDRVKKALDDQTKILKTSAQVAKLAEGSYNALEAEMKEIGKQLKNMTNAFDPLTGKINKNNKEAVELSKRYLEINKTLKTVDGQIGNFQRNVGNYSSAFKGLSGTLKSLGTSLLSVVGTFAIGSIVKESIDEFLEADKIVRIFKNTLKNLGIPEEFDSISKSVDRLQDQFSYLDDDDITQVFNQFIRYGKLTKNQINELLPVIINFAADSGVSLEESASLIIKALEGNGKALKEYGISMKDAKTVTQGFDLIMKELKPRVEGVADAFGDSAAGKVAKAQQEFKELKEELGEGLLPLLVKVLSVLNTALAYVKELTGTGPSVIIATALKDGLNADGVQRVAATNTQLYLNEFKSQMDQRKKLIEDGKKFEKKTDEELTASYIKGLQKRKQGYDELVKKLAPFAALRQKSQEFLSALAEQKALADAIAKLEPLAGGNKVLGIGDPNENRGGDKGAKDKLGELVKKQQDTLKSIADLAIAEALEAYEKGLIDEEDFQIAKLAIIKEYADLAIELEKSRGKNAEKKVITDLNKEKKDAEREYNSFSKKSAEERINEQAAIETLALKKQQELILSSKIFTDQEKLALELEFQNSLDQIQITALEKRIKLETDAKKKADLERQREELQLAISTRNRSFDDQSIKDKYETEIRAAKNAYDIIKAGRDTSFREEMAFLEKLKRIKLKYSKDTAEEELAIEELKAEKSRAFREELEATIIQGIQTGLEITQNLVTGSFDTRIAQLETEKEKELEAAGTNAAAREAIEDRYNKKIAEQKNKQARADRSFALFNVGINTAQGIAKTIAQFGMPAAIPFIALVAVQGALQAAAILSRPLPKYAKGRTGGPAEMAVVDEIGSELIIDKHGRLKEVGTDDGPRVTQLESGDSVVTASRTKQMLKDMEITNIMKHLSVHRMLSGAISQGRQDEMAVAFSKAIKGGSISKADMYEAFRKALKEMPKSDFFFDERGFRKRTTEVNTTTTYLNNIGKV